MPAGEGESRTVTFSTLRVMTEAPEDKKERVQGLLRTRMKAGSPKKPKNRRVAKEGPAMIQTSDGTFQDEAGKQQCEIVKLRRSKWEKRLLEGKTIKWFLVMVDGRSVGTMRTVVGRQGLRATMYPVSHLLNE